MHCDTTDDNELHRFVLAQQPVYATAVSELTAGRKQTYWIWFVFPQVEGLGLSAILQRYAVSRRLRL